MATIREGHLSDWSDIQDAHQWDALLLGNGLSMNVWGNFGYDSLFEEAKRRGWLAHEDAPLFDRYGTNFEGVLRALSTHIEVAKAVGVDPAPALRRHGAIRDVLSRAVHGVHVTKGEVPLKTLAAINDEVQLYRHVFTTSYDLLIYWAAGQTDFEAFVDYFWARDCNAFDESSIWLPEEWRGARLHFLHGGLHLVAMSSGFTCKRTAQGQALLDQFGHPHLGDDAARPLIVTEGHATDKVRSITDNDYLSYCLKQLRTCDAPLVVFGQSLSEQDAHLINALNDQPEKPIAVGLRDKGDRDNRREKYRIQSLLDREPVLFYNSETQPLGAKELRMAETPWRKLL